MLMNIGDVLCQPANKQNEEISTKKTKNPVNSITPRNFAKKNRYKLIEPFSSHHLPKRNKPIKNIRAFYTRKNRTRLV